LAGHAAGREHRARAIPVANGPRGEISYDLVMEDNMSFVEGTYRLPGGEWQVFIFSRFADVSEPDVQPGRWDSGVAGVFVRFPKSGRLGKAEVEQVLAAATGVEGWTTVRGPDSMQLR
jgi:hypothetical protein